MAAGIIIRNPATGAVMLNSFTPVGHIRAVFTTNGSSGSQTIPGLSRGIGFVLSALPTTDSLINRFPEFSVSGDVVSWTGATRPMRVTVASRSR